MMLVLFWSHPKPLSWLKMSNVPYFAIFEKCNPKEWCYPKKDTLSFVALIFGDLLYVMMKRLCQFTARLQNSPSTGRNRRLFKNVYCNYEVSHQKKECSKG